MKFLLPYFHPKASVVHSSSPDAKIVFVALVLVACWAGVYLLPLAWGYGILGLFLVISFGALAIATNSRAAVRMSLLPAMVGLTWVALYGVVEAYHWWAHIRGIATDAVTGSLTRHVLTRFAFGLRRVVALFCSAAVVSAFVVSTSVTDLRRARLVPAPAVLNLELFMSMFTRFQWRVRRIVQGHELAGFSVTVGRALRPGPGNAMVLMSHGLVVFVISVLRDIPAIFNYRALKKRVAEPGAFSGD